MSKVVEFRQHVMDVIKANVTDLKDVDWFDGMFDEEDVDQWVLKNPCAFVSVERAPSTHEVTGELNIDLGVTVIIVVEDGKKPRDADMFCWELTEKIAVLANFNTFGDPNAAPATRVEFRRIKDPDLRREGVAVGTVRWSTGLTIGNNRVLERDFIYNPKSGAMITKVPDNVTATGNIGLADGTSDVETVQITDQDEAV